MASKSAAALWNDYEDHLRVNLEEQHAFPIGVLQLHQVTSADGGIPGGSIIQLLGENGTGKTTLSLDLLANAQRSGLREVNIAGQKINAIILDFERSFDEDYAKLLGVDTDKVKIIRTKYAEDSFELAEAALLQGIQFFLVDSVGMLVSQEEADKSHKDPEKVAAEAKALGRFIKHVNAFMDGKTLVVIINQYRANLKQMGHAPDKKAYGAKVMAYANKLTWELRKVKTEEDRDYIEVFVAKNKLGGRKGIKIPFEIVSTLGIDYAQEVFDLALAFGIVEQKGKGRYYFGDIQAHGKEKAKSTLPMDEIRKAVLTYIDTIQYEETEENDESMD